MANMEREPILSARDVEISFSLRGRKLNAIRRCSLDLYQGETLAIVGESGSGKSVFTKSFLGMLDANGSITGGTIMFEGNDLAKYKTEKDWMTIRGKKISMVMQDPMTSLNPLKKIGRQIEESIELNQGIKGPEAKKLALEMLKKVGIPDPERRYQQYPHEFSGGMRQRVLIAMGIAAGADLVLADEPTKGLDRRRIALVEDAFQRLGERTLLCVTHDLRFAHAISSRVVVMYASQQIESGDSPSFFAEPLHPYSRAMLEALPENGLRANMGFAPPRQDVDAQSVCHFYGRCPWRSERCRKAPPLMTVGKRKVRCWKYAD